MSTTQTGFKADSGWVILSATEAQIKAKIESVGIPLKDWDVQIYRGILTGYNEAFIIDQKTKDELIIKSGSTDLSSIIRPILRGRDIKRYTAEFGNKWLINAHNGDKQRERIDLEKDYPIVYDHLKKFEPELSKRYDKGHHWSNLRNCA